MYQYYGDTRILNEHYDGVKKYVDNLRSMTDSSGLLSFGYYGDWCGVARGSNYDCGYKSTVVSSFYYLLEVEILTEVATLLGKLADARFYGALAQRVRAVWNDNLYDFNSHKYLEGYQTYQILPFLLDLVPRTDYNNWLNVLLNDIINTNDRHFTVGIVGAKYLLPVLSAVGRDDLAFELASQTTYPSWGYFLSQGATTLWENWYSSQFVAYGSRNHIMYGGQAAWYFQGLAGINRSPFTVGYSNISFTPASLLGNNLTSVSASIATHRGEIASSWHVLPPELCASAPEHQTGSVSCVNGTISKISFASFGTPTGVCGNFTKSLCHAESSQRVVENFCLGKSSCSVPAEDATFGDPCPNVIKWLYFQVEGCSSFVYTLGITVPVNSLASVAVPKRALSDISIFESNQLVWQNNKFVPGVPGVVSGLDQADRVIFEVGSGSYQFQLTGKQGLIFCSHGKEGEAVEASCPPEHTISHIRYASFGDVEITSACGSSEVSQTNGCQLGSSKAVVERECLHKNSCRVDASAELFGDKFHKICPNNNSLHFEYICSKS